MRVVSSLALSVATGLLVTVAACGDDGGHKLDGLQVSDVNVTTPEDTALAVTIPVDDADNVTLTVTIATMPTHGTLASSADATTWTYTPAANYDGSDAFVATVSDGQSSAQAHVNITVSPVDDAPVAGSDSFAAAVNTPLTIAVTTLLQNDTDLEGDALSITGVTAGATGTVALSGTDVVFTPPSGFEGAATFTYTLSDGQVTSLGNVTVQVGADNPPIAEDDALTTLEDTALVVADGALLGNDHDPDAQTLAITSAGNAVHGTVSHVGTKITFTPDANFNGSASFDYTITDGAATDTGTVAVTVTAVPDAPTAGSDTAITVEDTPVTIAASDLLANDTDVDGDDISIVAVTALAHGTPVLSGDGQSITFTPDPDFFGAATFSYTVSDGALSTTAIVTVTVTPVNDAPVATDDTVATLEDVPATISAASLLANDIDVDGDTLTLTAVTAGSNGTATLNSGVITFTPDANFHGTGSFDYTVDDGHDATDTGTVTVTVTSVNDQPVAAPDAVTIDEDTVASIAVLDNDSDVDGDTLSLVSFTQGAHGAVNASNGVIAYTPAANFNGTDAFTYTVSDGVGGVATASVTVTVRPVNDAPVAGDDTLLVAEDTTGTQNLLANDSDADGDALAISAHTDPTHGVLTLSGGVATYKPAANYNGPDSFQYTISDNHGGTATATVTIVVQPVNDLPTANPDTLATDEDTAGSLDVVANDRDIDGDTLGVADFTQPAHGTVSFTGNVATYTPNANYNGPDSFKYTVDDGQGGTATGTVSVTVRAVNDAPVAGNDVITSLEDSTGSVDTSLNDSDIDGDTLTITGNSTPAHGTVVFTGKVAKYTPNPNFNGADSFTYTVDDAHGGTATATVAVTVTPVNDAPVAKNDTLTTNEDTAGTVDLFANDSDVDGDAFTITSHTNPTKGTLALSGGVATFTPTANVNGTDSFTYTIDDGHGATSTATVSITITAVNDTPVAVAHTLTTAEDTAGTVDLLAGDTDVDGDTLTVSAHTNGAHGTVAVNASGVATYTPAANFNGGDSFTYTISDGHGGTATATVTVTVTPVNDNPVAKADSLTTAEDTAGTVNVLANDTDVDGDTLSVSANTSPTNGTVSFSGGVATYTPKLNFHGADSFKYTADDGHGGTSQGTVTVTVTSVNDPPVAVDDPQSLNEDTQISFNVLTNDSDVDGDTLTVAAHTTPAHGTLTISTAGAATYKPNANFNGSDSFTYTASDGHGGTATATVAITIVPVNDAPVAVTDAKSTNEDTPLAFPATDLSGNDQDVDGDTLSVTAVQSTAATHGTVALAAGVVTYTPALDFHGAASFTYTVSDGHGGTDTGTVNITVVSVNDKPVAKADTYSATEDTKLTVVKANGVLVNDTDADGDTLTAILVSNASNGTVALASDGSFTYTPTANSNGTDTFTYKANDGTVDSDPATVTISVAAVDDAPVAKDDAFSGNEDTTITGAGASVLTNDTDIENDALTAVLVTGPAAASTTSFTLNTDGTFSFVPKANFNGDVTFTYKAKDTSNVQSAAAATVTIHVTPVNDPPTAVDDLLSTNEDQGLTIPFSTLTTNDSDIDGDSPLTITAVSLAVHGSATLDAANSQITFTPAADFNGTGANGAAFTYTLSDGHGGTDTAVVKIDVAPVDDAPVAVDDPGLSLPQDSSADFNVVANDTDIDSPNSSLTPTVTTAAKHGSTSIVNRQVHYVPNEGFVGTDSFKYTVSDGTLSSDASKAALASITVTHTNHAPIASDDRETVQAGQTATFQLSATDPDTGDTLKYAIDSTGTGTVSVDQTTGVATYTAPDAPGTDSFTFIATDNHGLASDPATVSIDVGGVTTDPRCGDHQVNGNEQCDDGNSINGDGCETDCTFTCGGADAIADSVDPRTGNCFASFSSLDAGTLTDSAQLCYRLGAHLATITSAGENTVAAAAVTEQPLRIGGVGTSSTNLHWISGEKLTFSAFAPPPTFSQVGESCIQIESDGTWSAQQCTELSVPAPGIGTLCEFDFLPTTPQFAADAAPFGIAFGDFNGDSFQDVATTVSTGKVDILLGDGAGGLFPAVSIAVGGTPHGIAAADLDHDGHTDLAVAIANGQSNTLVPLFGDGTGQFAAGTSIPVGTNPNGVAIADIVGHDGILDIVVANTGGDSISIIGGTGTRQLAVDQTIRLPAGTAPEQLVVPEDFAEGGAIITANAGGQSVSVVTQGGASIQSFAVGIAAVSIVAADFNNDSLTDIAVSNNVSGTVVVLLNDGAGGLGTPSAQPHATLVQITAQPQALALADLNGDGLQDLIVADRTTNRATVLLATLNSDHNPDGSFAADRAFELRAGPFVLGVDDLDADSTSDLVIGQQGAVTLGVLLDAGSFAPGTPETPLAVPTGAAPSHVVVADFDGDGVADFAVTGSASLTLGFTVDGGRAVGTHVATTTLATDCVVTTGIVAADLDSDGDQDLVIGCSSDNTLLVLTNDGLADFTVSRVSVTGPGAFAVDDLDADGLADIAVVSSSTKLLVLHGIPNGFAAPITVATEDGITGVAIADLGGSKDPDIAITLAHAAFAVLTGHGDLTFDRAEVTLQTKASGLAVGDFDANGVVDVAVFTAAGVVSVRPNTGSGFSAQKTVGTFAGVTKLAAGNLDGDATADLVLGDTRGVDVLFGQTGATFLNSTIPAQNAGDAAFGDLDGDGHPDVVVTDSLDGQASVLVSPR